MTQAVARFASADLAELALQPAQESELRWFEMREAGKMYEAAGQAFTLRQRGRVVFCGGAIERHPNYATLWALFGEELDFAAARFLLGRTRSFIAGLPHRRVDALVEDRAAAIKWALRLGLRAEARLEAATLAGEDMIVFRRIE